VLVCILYVLSFLHMMLTYKEEKLFEILSKLLYIVESFLRTGEVEHSFKEVFFHFLFWALFFWVNFFPDMSQKNNVTYYPLFSKIFTNFDVKNDQSLYRRWLCNKICNTLLIFNENIWELREGEGRSAILFSRKFANNYIERWRNLPNFAQMQSVFFFVNCSASLWLIISITFSIQINLFWLPSVEE